MNAGWLAALAEIAGRQLFFVGGAPRSGTTWLQQMLDAHPDVSCQGEGLFLNQLAIPIEGVMASRRAALADKNARLFQHTGGYPLPEAEDTETLVGVGILLALARQLGAGACRAVGEKTPENVFMFPRLRALFPDAKFIAVARDPRDVLASAWHFFRPSTGEGDTEPARTAFVTDAIPAIDAGARAMLDFAGQHPRSCAIVTYETLSRSPEPALAALFRLLGVDASGAVAAECAARASFAAVTGGRPRGVEDRHAFLRRGVAGEWRSTLSEREGEMVARELGWMFPRFGWPIS